MIRFRSVLMASGITLLISGCSGDEQLPTGMNAAVQPAAKPAAGLKVTPSQLNLPGTGAIATLSVTPSGQASISVAVSTPACVSVALKSEKGNQLKYTVTATAAGSCTLTVTDGGTGNVQVPVTIAGTVALRSTLAAGLFHTCGLDLSGAAWCWGWNDYGQLGTATNMAVVAANPVPVAVAGGLVFVSLTAGHNHTCGLTAAGAVHCWGGNYSGQLGNPTGAGDLQARIPTPVLVEGGLAFTAIESGNNHVCGLTGQGELYCWGTNSLGQLGSTTNSGLNVANPTPALVSGGLTFIAFTSGANHTCGVVTGGSVYCWGDNTHAALGNSTAIGQGNVPQPTPALVQGLPAVASLVATNHTCALTPAGAAWCWGSNQAGQLGLETSGDRTPTPVEVSGGLSFLALGAGGGHTCGVVSGGAVYCWGGNVAGQLGTSTNFGTPTLNYSPALVPGVSLTALAVNAAHTCGLTSGGQGWCWGANAFGQLGNTENNLTQLGVYTPAVILGGLTFATP